MESDENYHLNAMEKKSFQEKTTILLLSDKGYIIGIFSSIIYHCLMLFFSPGV